MDYVSRITLFQFGKAQTSSLISTAVDFTLAALFFHFMPWPSKLCTLLGGISGGATNCTINYFWTFKGCSRKKFHIICRYFLVWQGSLALNVFGTEMVSDLLSSSEAHSDIRYMISKAIAAVSVAVIWNFFMQKRFVFKSV